MYFLQMCQVSENLHEYVHQLRKHYIQGIAQSSKARCVLFLTRFRGGKKAAGALNLDNVYWHLDGFPFYSSMIRCQHL